MNTHPWAFVRYYKIFKHKLLQTHDSCGINLSFHIDYWKSGVHCNLAIHVGSLRLAPITCNRPQQVFPRGLPKIIMNLLINAVFTSFCQDLDGYFIHTQKAYDCGFAFINFTLCISMDIRFPKDHIHAQLQDTLYQYSITIAIDNNKPNGYCGLD